MTDKPDSGAAQMTGPDKIYAHFYVNKTGREIESGNDFTLERVEYHRTAAHPVTVDMLKRWETTATAYPWISEAEFLTEIRTAIAQIEAMK